MPAKSVKKSTPKPRPITVGLALVVHNDSKRLPRLAESLRGQIDYWTIVDAGSTDGSMELAWTLFRDSAGQVVPDEERSYGSSLSVALNASRAHTGWVLVMDASETLVGTIPKKIPVKCNGAEIQIRQEGADRGIWRVRLIESASDWYWEGEEGGRLARHEGEIKRLRTTTFRLLHHDL